MGPETNAARSLRISGGARRDAIGLGNEHEGMQNMEIERLEESGVTVVTVRGVINFGESAQEFSSYLHELLDAGVPSVLIDMSGIDNVDSTGLGELVGYLQRFEKEGRRLALYRPHRRILSLLRLTRLDEIFPIFEDRAEAVAALSS